MAIQKIIGAIFCFVTCYNLVALIIYLKSTDKKSLKLYARRDFIAKKTNDGGAPIVIIAYMRSGSTLTGNIIQSSPETFYLYEPLIAVMRQHQNETENIFPNFMYKSVRPTMSVKEEVLNIFRAWFTCDLDFIIASPHRYHLGFFKFSHGSNKLIGCMNKTFKSFTMCMSLMKTLCLQSKQRVIKTIRTPMHWIYELMHEFPAMKIIHLVRDPRAIIASQQKFSKCSPEYGGLVGCSRLLCTNMEDDITMFEMYNKLFPGRTMRLKYEDLATDPLNTTQSIFKYLDFELTESIIKYVKRITMSGRTPKYDLDSVRPDSRAMVDAWRTNFNSTDLDKIQVICEYTMDKLSYNHFQLPKSNK